MLCHRCTLDKPDDAFPWRNRLKGVKHRVCNACVSSTNKAYYRDNPEKFKQRNRRAYATTVQRGVTPPMPPLVSAESVVTAALGAPVPDAPRCFDCGTDDWRVLVADPDRRVVTCGNDRLRYLASVGRLRAQTPEREAE